MTAIGAAAIVGSASAQELTGTYGSFSEAALQSAALDVFGESQDGDDFASQTLEYFSFGINVRAEYNDNIFLEETDEEEDLVFRVDVPLEISNSKYAENQWSIIYTPRFKFYADNSDQDGVDHFVDLGWKQVFAKTSVDLGVEYDKIDGADRFASGTIARDMYKARLGVSHQYSGKSRFDFDLGFRADEFDDARLFDRERYNTRVSWQYQVTGKIQIGPFVGYEHVSIDGESNPDQDAVSFGLRGNYQALQKTTLVGYVGAEYRDYDGGSRDSDLLPTFELGAQHQLTGKTTLTGLLYHNTRASYSDRGQSYNATGVNLVAAYAATARISARAGVSYEHDNYFGTSSANAPDLDSDYITFFAGASYVTDLGVTLGSGIRFSNNDSDTETRDFDNFILNFNASYTY